MANEQEQAPPTPDLTITVRSMAVPPGIGVSVLSDAEARHVDLVAHMIHNGLGDGSAFAIACAYDKSPRTGEHRICNWCPPGDQDRRRGRGGGWPIYPASFRLVKTGFEWKLPLQMVCDPPWTDHGDRADARAIIKHFGIEPHDLDNAPAFAEAVAQRLVIERKAMREGPFLVRYECLQGWHRRARSGYFDVRFGVYRCTRCEWPNAALVANQYNDETVFGSSRYLAQHQRLSEPSLAEAFLAALARRRAERAAKET